MAGTQHVCGPMLAPHGKRCAGGAPAVGVTTSRLHKPHPFFVTRRRWGLCLQLLGLSPILGPACCCCTLPHVRGGEACCQRDAGRGEEAGRGERCWQKPRGPNISELAAKRWPWLFFLQIARHREILCVHNVDPKPCFHCCSARV